MPDLTTLTLAEAAAHIRAGTLSPLTLTEAYLERIARLNPALNAFITVTAERARQDAAAAEREIAAGRYHGTLHGIPLAYKDLFETAGILTTAGSQHFADHIPGRDAAVVDKLTHAGAVLLGKTNMHEIALGVLNDNPFYGHCHNPYDVARISGGSSGGSAVALAAGLCLGALGSDTRGSIRIPAALCGVVGFKPTYGRISLRGTMPLSWSLDHAGPMARTVRDVAILYEALAGYDPDDPFSIDYPMGDVQGDLEGGIVGWRVAAADDDYFQAADPDITAAFEAAVGVFTTLGADVQWVDMSWLRAAGAQTRIMRGADAAAFHRERIERHPEKFSPPILARLQEDSAFTAIEYAEARHVQSLATHRLGAFFEGYDLLLTSATPLPALSPEAAIAWTERGYDYNRFCTPFNMTGVPALSLPGGFTRDGLPIGLQLVAPQTMERHLLRAAYAYEKATQWTERHPNFA
ncbi:MAG: amidase [Anaerolineales bacterium]|nr:amidase [Anaerolineales bacterium]